MHDPVAKVFVIQDHGKIDFAKAKRFGELVYMVKRDAFPDNAEDRMRVASFIMKDKLTSFKASQDHLLLTGDPLAIAMAVLVLASYGVFDISCLKWDRENAEYYAVRVAI